MHEISPSFDVQRRQYSANSMVSNEESEASDVDAEAARNEGRMKEEAAHRSLLQLVHP